MLSKLVQNSSDLETSVYFDELEAPSIEHNETLAIESETQPKKMEPLLNFLDKWILPEDKTKSPTNQCKSRRFFTKDGILYRRTFTLPILRCVGPNEANYCLIEIHEGLCGDHMTTKALAYKIIRQGYYWPTIHSNDALALIKKCLKCQLFSKIPRKNPALPSFVLSPIPFAIWGSI